MFEHFIMGAQGPGAELAWGFVDSTEFHLKGFRVPANSQWVPRFSTDKLASHREDGTAQAVLQKIRRCGPTS